MDAFKIKVHAFKYLEMKWGVNLRFSITWEFTQGSTGKVFSDTSSGNLAWIEKETGKFDWTPHLTGAGYRKSCFHTLSPDLDALVREQVMNSGHMKPLVEAWENSKDDQLVGIPDIPDEDLEIELS